MNIKNKWVHISVNDNSIFRFFHVKQVSDGYLECDKYIQFSGANLGDISNFFEQGNENGLISLSAMNEFPCAYVVNLFTYVPINGQVISEVPDYEATVNKLQTIDFQRKEEPKKSWW